MFDISEFPGLTLQSVPLYLLMLLLCTLRVGSFLVASPFFGSRMVPLQVRIVFSFALGVWILSNIQLPPTEILFGKKLMPIVFQELFIGLACGLALSICFATVVMAGEKIAATSGLAFASSVDPASGAQSPVISQLFSMFLLILFFSLSGHLLIFELILRSYERIPIGAVINYFEMLEIGLSSGGFVFEKAIIIVIPIISILLFINLAIGFITKTAPQLNLFSFGFPMTIMGSFFVVYFSIDALQFAFSSLLDESIGIVRYLLRGSDDG